MLLYMFLRMVSTGWAAEEFKTIDLGDKRPDKRAVLLAERLAEKPTASIPGTCSGWAETQAAYRFLAQYGVAWQDILEARIGGVRPRAWAHNIVRLQPRLAFVARACGKDQREFLSYRLVVLDRADSH